ncbi:hypothetical protein [Nocardioides terrisoli]|uniref:hypothetical protein n=1 Tax=Nocardioides terrisoli TaxID=3388267 RepID=UPI00287B69D0|nr:hypothetical protein [Nocardioides marmorisolisilvae]
MPGPGSAARRVLATWSRPRLDYHHWWAGLRPLLNAEGRQDYAYTDPSQIPRLTLTGLAVVRRSPVATAATVWFDTDHGLFGVRLSRRSPTAPWLAAEIIFPRHPQPKPQSKPPSHPTTGFDHASL